MLLRCVKRFLSTFTQHTVTKVWDSDPQDLSLLSGAHRWGDRHKNRQFYTETRCEDENRLRV